MQIKHKQAVLSFQKSGHGPNTLLLFHGFGQDHTAFAELCKAISDTYTCYSIDLFFHGESEWNYGSHPISKEFLMELMGQFLIKNQIQQFSTLGFSIGSRFALACTELFPSRIKNLFLLAPDSVQTNFWYRLATSSATGRTLFKWVVFHPQSWQAIASLAQKIKLATPSLLRFASKQLNNEPMRSKVYYTWVVFRKLKFDIKSLCRVINTHDINLTVFVGRKDPVITPDDISELQKFIPGFKPLVLDCTHSGLVKLCIEYIRRN